MSQGAMSAPRRGRPQKGDFIDLRTSDVRDFRRTCALHSVPVKREAVFATGVTRLFLDAELLDKRIREAKEAERKAAVDAKGREASRASQQGKPAE
jgi:hypothetical protein